jgi:hypothetical protein
MSLARHRIAVLCCLTAVLCAPPARAFEIEMIQTRYAQRQYQCELRVRLDAPIERVEAVLREYERYPALDARILRARVLERPAANVAVLETTLRACFGPFCRNVRRVERVEESPHALSATADPARSDVRFGETHTELSALKEGGTLVSYRTRITPAFWIPPIVGRHWMLGTLEHATSELFRNVELQAQESVL